MLQKESLSVSMKSRIFDNISYSRIIGVIFLVTLLTSLVSFNTSNSSLSISQLNQIYSNVDVSLSIVNINYPQGLVSQKSKYLPWDFIVEPYQSHKASISGLKVNELSLNIDDYSVQWNIGSQTFYGNNVNFKVVELGNLTSTIVIKSNADSNSEYVYEFFVVSKYVRREIRNLTSTDRTDFFNALMKLYTVSETEGKTLYGEKFQTMEYFLTKHLAGAGTTDCDHWHDGAGILVHHMAFTLEVEQALQSINPSISMPYWEYGMDAILYTNWQTSPIFNDDWFGEASPKSLDHSITKGIWKGIELPDGSAYKIWDISNTGTLNPYVNAYGQLRSPWNNNPSNFFGRRNNTFSTPLYSSFPTCDTFYDCFSYDTLADINYCANGVTHGPVHILIGGSWEKEQAPENECPSSFLASFPRVLVFKILWRKGYARCPTNCSAEEYCACYIPEEYIQRFGAYAIFEDINIASFLSTSYTDDQYLSCLYRVGDAGIAGDMFTSAAPFDPTFWPLHGSLERLVDLKRILVSLGNVTNFNETWGFTKYDDDIYLSGVCDWSNVKDVNDLTLPLCDSDASCPGHNADDVIEFGNFLNTGDTYTAKDFYEFMHPWNVDLPYTYDTFDYDYCIDSGYNFDP